MKLPIQRGYERLFTCLPLSAFYLPHSQTTSSQTTGDHLTAGQAEATHLSPQVDGSHYGATGNVRCPADSQECRDEKHMDRKEGCHNRGYQADDEYAE